MAFNNYIELPEAIRKQLKFLGDPYYYLYRDSGGKTLRGLLFEITEENMNKAYKRLTGGPGEIVSGDKVYVLPNCRIPMYKLTNFFKETGAVQTPDVSEADKIIGHERVFEKTYHQPLGSVMLIEFPKVNWKSAYDHNRGNRPVFDEVINDVKDVFAEDLSCSDTIVSSTLIASWLFDPDLGLSPTNFVTPTGAWILYNHLLKKTLIINEDEIFEKIGKPTVIDQGSYETLKNMLGSQDEDSQKTGAELLANCDINPSLYWIWKLCNQFGATVRNLSSYKNIRLFIRMSRWDRLGGMTAEDFIKYMHKKGLLTRQYFAELVKEAAMPYGLKLQSEIFSMVITPSKEYQQYAEGEKFEFNWEPENEQVEVTDDV